MAQLTDTLVSGDERVTGMIYGTQAGNYATCSTPAATAAKVVTIPGFVLTLGVHVRIKFSANNTAATPTLNVSETGAKSIKVKGNNLAAAGDLAANGIYEFVYDGTNWELTGAVCGKATTANYGYVQLATGDMNGAANVDGVAVSKNHTHSQYLPKSGGTMTGGITLPTNFYHKDSKFGIDAKNSDIINANSIYFGDECTDTQEGIHFKRGDSGNTDNYDTFWVDNGKICFVPNHAVSTATASSSAQIVPRLPSSVSDNQVVLTNGTTGALKTSEASSLSVGSATTATDYNTSSGTIKTALDGKANGTRWRAVTKGQTWSRLFYSEPVNTGEGCSGILAVSCTRGIVVCNATFLITTSHNGATKSSVIELASCDYTPVRSRIVVNSSGNYYFEVYDTAQSISASTTQAWHCSFVPLLGANITTYTAFTDGTTVPTNYTATNDFTTTGGKAAAAIKNITRSGTTFTATRQDGSTFTFTQQDSNTDTKVTATAKTTDNVNYKILATASASPTSGAATEAVYDPDITLNPSTNTISANISGNAATATAAASVDKIQQYTVLGSTAKPCRIIADYQASIPANTVVTVTLYIYSFGYYGSDPTSITLTDNADGIIKISYKTGSSANALGNLSAYWLVRNRNISPSLVTACIARTSSSTFIAVTLNAYGSTFKVGVVPLSRYPESDWTFRSSDSTSAAGVAHTDITDYETTVIKPIGYTSGFSSIVSGSDNATNIGGNANSASRATSSESADYATSAGALSTGTTINNVVYSVPVLDSNGAPKISDNDAQLRYTKSNNTMSVNASSATAISGGQKGEPLCPVYINSSGIPTQCNFSNIANDVTAITGGLNDTKDNRTTTIVADTIFLPIIPGGTYSASDFYYNINLDRMPLNKMYRVLVISVDHSYGLNIHKGTAGTSTFKVMHCWGTSGLVKSWMVFDGTGSGRSGQRSAVTYMGKFMIDGVEGLVVMYGY